MIEAQTNHGENLDNSADISALDSARNRLIDKRTADQRLQAGWQGIEALFANKDNYTKREGFKGIKASNQSSDISSTEFDVLSISAPYNDVEIPIRISQMPITDNTEEIQISVGGGPEYDIYTLSKKDKEIKVTARRYVSEAVRTQGSTGEPLTSNRLEADVEEVVSLVSQHTDRIVLSTGVTIPMPHLPRLT